MKIFNLYLLKNLGIATAFITLVLTFIIFLTQSLRFLEIVINAGSSGSTFWILTSLALPRFFEVILPIAIMAATLFQYNKMTTDSELIAMRATGHSSFSLSKPAIILGCIITVLLWVNTLWIAPASLAQMQKMKHAIKTDFSALLFKEGVFNQIGQGLTVYISQKRDNGELVGLMIHDTREKGKPPKTVLAKYGKIIISDKKQQVIVYDVLQQEYDSLNGILQKLTTDRYTIDLPESGLTQQRWAEPDERTINQLLRPDYDDARDVRNLREFSVEVHRRFTSPLLALCFPLIALTILLLGPLDRRGQMHKIIVAVIVIMAVQGLFLAAYNLARNSNIGLLLMYILTLAPTGFCLFWLSGYSESTRRKLLFTPQKLKSKSAA